MTEIIIKNLTGAEQHVEDLGIYIPASTSVNFSTLFEREKFTPSSSVDLLNLVNTDKLLLNDGVSDIAKANTEAFLKEYAVNEHLINNHTGNYSEINLQDNNIFARLSENETITGVWTVDSVNGGQLHIEHGTTLPTGTLADGRIFWHIAEELLYASANGAWINVTYVSDAYYQSPLIYEFGSYSTFDAGYINTQWKVSSTSPIIVPKNGTIKTLSCDAGADGTVNSYRFTIRRKSGSSWVDFVHIDKMDGAGYIISSEFNVDFVAGDKFACYAEVLSGSGDLTNPHLYLEVVWRQ